MGKLDLMPRDADKNEMDWRNFLLRVSAGLIPGMSFVNKFGENPGIDTATAPEDVWSYQGLYNFSTTADITKLSSSNAGDDQLVQVQGLDTDWNLSLQTATLDGQNKVTLGTPLVRVFRVKNIGSTDIAGVLYCYVDGAITSGVPDVATTVRAVINGDNNQTEMAIYTVPAGKTGYLISHYVNGSRIGNNASICTLRQRTFGGVFRIHYRTSLIGTGTNNDKNEMVIPLPLNAKTDILWRVDSVSANNSGIAAGFSILLVDD